MGKHALSNVKGDIRRADLFYVDIDLIKVVPGRNPRRAYRDHAELVAAIQANVVTSGPSAGNVANIAPLRVYKNTEGELELLGGHRRLKAARDVPPPPGVKGLRLPVQLLQGPKQRTEADLKLLTIADNNGLPFTPVEEAEAFQALVQDGVDVATIAAHAGRSVSHVRNRLRLARCPEDVKAAVEDGRMTVNDAINGMVREPVPSGRQVLFSGTEAAAPIEDNGETAPQAKIRPYRKKRLVLAYGDDWRVKQTGMKKVACAPVEDVLADPAFRFRLEEAGFDPATIRITVEPLRELG